MRLSFFCSVILLGAGCHSMSPTTLESKSTETPMPNDSNVAISPLGTTANGQEVHLYTLTNANGLVAKVSTYGALLTEMHVPDRDGQLKDITLGFKDLKSYEAGHPYFGATIGRYGNRIAKGPSRFMASPTPSPPTMMPTISMEGWPVLTRKYGRLGPFLPNTVQRSL